MIVQIGPSKPYLHAGAGRSNRLSSKNGQIPEILFITSYPPRECGIATYSQDIIRALRTQFMGAFKISICALETDTEQHRYGKDVTCTWNTRHAECYRDLAEHINGKASIGLVVVQHEFGFFQGNEAHFIGLLKALSKPIVTVFHTVLPGADILFKTNVRLIASLSQDIVVMTHTSATILTEEYCIPLHKIAVIPHGTHLVSFSDKTHLKHKYGVAGRTVLSTFGLLSSGKNIETTLQALPRVIAENPDILFLIIGKTHPSIIRQDGEIYREMLSAIVEELRLQLHVRFVDSFLPLPILLEYLQLTDIYLFTSKDPNQAVSGTFSYAAGCGCPIVSTPIPHAREVLQNDAGIIIDFENPQQLANAVNLLLADGQYRMNISLNGLHRMAATAWENSAIAHVHLFEKVMGAFELRKYNVPEINLAHLKRMTTGFGIVQFAFLSRPDITSGYTLDDNARALIAMCQYFELTDDADSLPLLQIYLDFIAFCLQPGGNFLNYVDESGQFTAQNFSTNLADSNGRAIWALGYCISKRAILPAEVVVLAETILTRAMPILNGIHSTRAMAFIIKGLYYGHLDSPSASNTKLITEFADRLVQMYRHEADEKWQWFEGYLTYANSILPEALLCAWMVVGNETYRDIALSGFDFLINKTFTPTGIKTISNKNWLSRESDQDERTNGGEQPIEIAYTILALDKLDDLFKNAGYGKKMETAFNWFLGHNHLHQIIYNPATGGCYDGLEENYVNLNQGAESTVSYLMARLTMEKALSAKLPKKNLKPRVMQHA